MSAFRGAYYMKSIKISDNVTKIGRRAFEWCYGYLRSLTLPNSLREIDDYAFNGCDLLTSINIPANVEKIGEWAFDHCSSLRRVYCYAKPIQYTDVYSFPFMSGYYQKATLHVPADMIEAYRKAIADEKLDMIKGAFADAQSYYTIKQRRLFDEPA